MVRESPGLSQLLSIYRRTHRRTPNASCRRITWPKTEPRNSCNHCRPGASPRPSRQQRKGDTATTSTPPSCHRAKRHTVPQLPSRTRNSSAQIGTTAGATEKSTAYNLATSRAQSFSFLHNLFLDNFQLFRDHFQGPSDFTHHDRELRRQHRFFWIDDDIDSRHSIQNTSLPPHRFPQSPLDPVALHRTTQHAPDSESNSRTQSRKRTTLQRRTNHRRRTNYRRPIRTQQIKHGHERRKVPPPLLVYALEVRMFQQASRTRKSSTHVRRRLDSTPLRSVGAHPLMILHNDK